MSKASELLECQYCEARVNADRIGDYSEMHSELGEPVQFCLFKCSGCSSPILTMHDFDHQAEDFGKARILYPDEEKVLDWDIPDSVRLSYGEAQKCIKSHAYIAAVVMCRRTLEAIGNELGIKKRNLVEQLTKMREDSVIDGNMFEWSQMLRTTGNQAAHASDHKFSSQDARDTMDFTHAIIEFCFTYKKRFEEFKSRRESESKGS